MVRPELAMADLDAETATPLPRRETLSCQFALRQRHQRRGRQPRPRRQRGHDRFPGQCTGVAVPRLGADAHAVRPGGGCVALAHPPLSPVHFRSTSRQSTQSDEPDDRRPPHDHPTTRPRASGGGRRAAWSSWVRSRARASGPGVPGEARGRPGGAALRAAPPGRRARVDPPRPADDVAADVSAAYGRTLTRRGPDPPGHHPARAARPGAPGRVGRADAVRCGRVRCWP